MNTKVKIALSLLAGGSLLYFGLKKKGGKTKTFTAPDGNTYGKNQLYKTFDNKLFKNGKQVHFDTPNTHQNNQPLNNYYGKEIVSNYQSVDQNVDYHQKGVRHH